MTTRPTPSRPSGRRRRHRGVRQQPRPHGRGRRQGARRLSEAARGRRRCTTGLSDEITDMVKTLGAGRGILAVRSAARGRTADAARPAPISICGARRSSAWPAKSAEPVVDARPEGQALRRSGMVVEPVLRLRQAGLSAQHRTGPTIWSRTPRASTRTPGRRPSSTSSRSPTRSRRRISC